MVPTQKSVDDELIIEDDDDLPIPDDLKGNYHFLVLSQWFNGESLPLLTTIVILCSYTQISPQVVFEKMKKI